MVRANAHVGFFGVHLPGRQDGAAAALLGFGEAGGKDTLVENLWITGVENDKSRTDRGLPRVEDGAGLKKVIENVLKRVFSGGQADNKLGVIKHLRLWSEVRWRGKSLVSAGFSTC